MVESTALNIEQMNSQHYLDSTATEARQQTANPGAFGSTLMNMVQDIDSMQQQVNSSIGNLTTEQTASDDYQQMLVDAGTTFDMMMGVKNKLMSAYQALNI